MPWWGGFKSSWRWTFDARMVYLPGARSGVTPWAKRFHTGGDGEYDEALFRCDLLCGPCTGAWVRQERERIFQQCVLEFGDLAGAAAHIEPTAVNHGDAGGVVSTVFETLETFDEEGRGLLVADVAHDSAHRIGFPLARGARRAGAGWSK